MTRFAIDVGLSWTKAAVVTPDQARPTAVRLGEAGAMAMPSVAHVGADGVSLVGDAAVSAIGQEPSGAVRNLISEFHLQSPARNKGAGQADRGALLAQLLAEVRRMCERVAGACDDCRLIVPPGFDAFRRERLAAVAARAGFKAVGFLEAAVAAGKWWSEHEGQGHEASELIVCDIGGATTSVSALRATGGNLSVNPEMPPRTFSYGCNEVDDLLLDALRVAEGGARPSAEPPTVLKHRLSRGKATASREPSGGSIDAALRELQRCCQPLTLRLRDAIERYCAEAKSKIGRTPPVLVSGGGARLLGIVEAVRAGWQTGTTHTPADPELAAVYGAIDAPRAASLGAQDPRSFLGLPPTKPRGVMDIFRRDQD